MIDKAYFEPDPALYFRDFFISMTVFVAAFLWGLHADWPWVVVAWGIASAFLARLGIFGHEISHRPNHKRMRPFYWVWHLTVGAMILVPTARFVGPHKTHHTTGIFRTKDDPQYLLIRSNGTLAFFVLVVLPLVTPFYTLFQAAVASIGGLRLEEALDRFTRKTFHFSVSTPLPDRKTAEVAWLSRYYLCAFIAFAVLVPHGIAFYYAVLAGAWLVVVLRIPLEHELDRHADGSDSEDQMRDSFTVETPLALLIQPIGFRYHTAHHMYPGVPYHHLPAVHEHLKATVPAYRASIVPYRTAIRGPKPAARCGPAAGPPSPSASSTE